MGWSMSRTGSLPHIAAQSGHAGGASLVPFGSPHGTGACGAGDGSGDTSATDYMRGNLDALYARTLGNLTGGTDTAPTASELYEDSGYGTSGKGRS